MLLLWKKRNGGGEVEKLIWEVISSGKCEGGSKWRRGVTERSDREGITRSDVKVRFGEIDVQNKQRSYMNRGFQDLISWRICTPLIFWKGERSEV